MIQKEYLTVNDVSQHYKTCTRRVRQIANSLLCKVSKELLHKDSNGVFRINSVMLHHFKLTRMSAKSNFSSITLDPYLSLSTKQIDEIMKWVFEKCADPSLQIHYVVERKKSTEKNHIHCYINSRKKSRFIQLAHIGFSQLQHYQFPVFDLAGWKTYLLKENNSITTLKTTSPCQT